MLCDDKLWPAIMQQQKPNEPIKTDGQSKYMLTTFLTQTEWNRCGTLQKFEHHLSFIWMYNDKIK
jgi:hypothetical protein